MKMKNEEKRGEKWGKLSTTLSYNIAGVFSLLADG